MQRLGRRRFVYNLFGSSVGISSEQPIPKGRHEIRMEFAYGAVAAAAADKGKSSKQSLRPGGTVSLYYAAKEWGKASGPNRAISILGG